MTAGATVTLARTLPSNAPTILTTHRWERRAAGETEFVELDGETSATLSFTATSADAGAAYRVTILKPNGQVGYGPSQAVTLSVN